MEEKITGDFIYWFQNGWVVGTPVNMTTGELLPSNGVCGDYKDWASRIWGGLPGTNFPSDYKKEFLSFEYIYDPKSFQDLSGNRWQVFRKNIRKFPGRYGNAPLRYIEATSEHEGDLKNLFLEWVGTKGEDQEIHDDEVMIDYLFHGNNRKILVDKNNYVLGVNIWDSNHFYINFRFNFSRNIKFLNEYLRYIFYTDPVILNQNKLVNDGGSLDNEKLAAFKEKLNPLEKREIFSYIKTEGQNEKE
jgi:hypothetical protein